ncbi:phosphate regulon sensor histidine kinase PhoR [Thiomicrorhabdus xiamenensis]|uniref:Phosphate regulon sensor protein PhoR n=1 Tax=Thiomicrorhabdus xiamenensis TaxID=2739063 RepID=A0A7D4SNP4_9GAMM|nr:phosphate regulon sensor histidine kinase PhoR [Thiomicrorhabdus xiamenensis]QKI89701.1 phosphate regulon sensor histidine kinase PhoR [Thiomicrorhabdus xiamenensis]
MLTSGIKRELTWVIGALWLAFGFAWLTGWWYSTSAGFVVLYIGRHLWSVRRFEKWIQGTSIDAHPPLTGLWSEVSYQVSKKQRALEKHADLNFYKSEQFKAASMLLPSAVVSIDQNHYIEWLNEPATRMLGLLRQDVGRRIEAIIRQPDFLEYLKSGDYRRAITLTLDQSRIFEVKIINYFENHRLLIATDITELYQLAQIRRDFVANASHELRTPLTVLHGYLELLTDMPHEPQWDTPLEHMSNQTVRMRAIIEDLLTLSSIEAGSINAKQEEVDVPKILEQLKAEVEQLASAGHRLKFEITPGLMIKGMPEPLKSVFMNLLSNAIRYSPDGGEVSVRWYADEEGAHFSVSDQGLGISPEHIPRLTERFYRVDKDRSRVTGGTGLGLAIVKHVLDKHDSHLEVSSMPGVGSTFGCSFALSRVVHTQKDA